MLNKPIKVLQVIRHMNLGGSETFIMNLYRNINKEQIQFDFLVFGPGVFDEEIKKLGGKIYYMKYITEIGPFKFKSELKKFLKKHNEYQIMHSHMNQITGIILETAKECDVKLRIAHSHCTNNSNGLFVKAYKKYLQKKIKSNANLLLACGEEAAKWLYKDRSNQAIIINNGVDIEKFKYSNTKRTKIREELKIPEDTKVLGHVGRFDKQKNHNFLIEIYNEYVKQNPNSILILVGKGELKENIFQKVKKYGIENNVKFLGLRQDMNYIYSAMDVFVFPSLYEGLSVALIEAQISGLKIFASNTIDKKSDISNNIKWLSLKTPAHVWSDSIINTNNNRDTSHLHTDEYNIKYIARKMEEIYLKKNMD